MPLSPRAHDLHAETQYILDGATEDDEMLGFHRSILDLFGDTQIIEAIINADRGASTNLFAARRSVSLELCRYAESLFPDVPDEFKPGLAGFAYAHARKIVADYAEIYSGWNFDDTVIGGAFLPFHYRCVRPDHSPTKGALRRLRSPSACRRYVRINSDQIDFLRPRLEILSHLAKPSSPDQGDDLIAYMGEQIWLRRQRQYAAFFESRAKAGKPPWKIKQETRARRKVISRAAVMAVGVLGAASVSAFARGEPVRIQGQEVAFDIRPRDSMAAIGHASVEIGIVDKGGAPLSKLCVYHDETPALDQLTAFALRVAAGQERDIIKTGNLYDVTDAAPGHDLLRGRLQSRDPAARWARRDAIVAHRQDYTAELGPVYREAVALSLFGRRAKEFLS